MGCVVIEIFPELEFNESDFGKKKAAVVNPRTNSSSIISVNTTAIAAFEEIKINTVRPNSTDNKVDFVDGVRIKTTWGQHLVVFNDVPMNFSKAMEAACNHQKISDITTLNSEYWQQFKRAV